MSWYTSNRYQRLPKDWSRIKAKILARDGYSCKIRDTVCQRLATEVDHIIPGDNHNETNLQAACRSCHARKSSREGHSKKARMRAQRFRPSERHPGSR